MVKWKLRELSRTERTHPSFPSTTPNLKIFKEHLVVERPPWFHFQRHIFKKDFSFRDSEEKRDSALFFPVPNYLFFFLTFLFLLLTSCLSSLFIFPGAVGVRRTCERISLKINRKQSPPVICFQSGSPASLVIHETALPVLCLRVWKEGEFQSR